MPIASPQPPIEIPNQGVFEFTFGDIASDDEDRIAVIDIADGSETSYAHLRAYIESVAGGLAHKGIGIGDVVALHCPNSLAFIIYAHAVWRLGAVLTPI